MWLYGWGLIMVNHHPVKCSGDRLCGSRDIFSVIKGKHFTYPLLNQELFFISAALSIPCSHTKFQNVDTMICQCVKWRTSDIGHTCLQHQLMKNTLKFLPVCPEIATIRKSRKDQQEVSTFPSLATKGIVEVTV